MELSRIAANFVVLREARHIADYDLTASYTRTEASAFIDRADQVFADWKIVQPSEEANVFLSALLFARRRSK